MKSIRTITQADIEEGIRKNSERKTGEIDFDLVKEQIEERRKDALKKEIDGAVALLEKNGYQVTKP